MSEYLELDGVDAVDPDALSDQRFAYLEANMPAGWRARPGHLDTVIQEAEDQQYRELLAMLGRVAKAIYLNHGLKVAKVAPLPAVAATGLVTFAARDTDGHEIPAGTAVSIAGEPFETVVDAAIPAASATVTVSVAASTPGAAGNDLDGAVAPREQLLWLQSLTLVGTTGGGRDAESASDYLDRLTGELQLLSRSIVYTDDAVKVARRVEGVGRVLSLHLHNGDTGLDDQPGCETIVITGPDGGAPDPAVIGGLLSLYTTGQEARRILPVRIWVLAPDYVDVTVDDVVVNAAPGWEPADVQVQVADAIASHLSPLTYGSPRGGETDDWRVKRTISLYALVGAIERAESVDELVSLTINGVEADFAMPGTAPLPNAIVGTITVNPAP